MSAKILLRPLDSLASLFVCDWGDCDKEAHAERWEPASKQWLSVCRRHAGRRGLAEGET